jgi:hypothetical protein
VANAGLLVWCWWMAPWFDSHSAARFGHFRSLRRNGGICAAGEGALEAGAAKVRLRYPPGLPLAGYSARRGKPSQGVHDPLFARALVLCNGKEKLVVISIDLVAVDKEFKLDLLRRLNNRPVRRLGQLSSRQLILCATHTHSGIGAMARQIPWQLACGRLRPWVREAISRQAERAVRLASSSLKPAYLSSAAVHTTVPFGRSRRGPQDAAFNVRSGLVLKVFRLDHRPLALVCIFAAHPTCLGPENMLVSADFPGYFCGALERKVGAGAVALFLNGAEGDVAPSSPSSRSGFAAAREVGEALAEVAASSPPRRASRRAGPTAGGQVRLASVEFRVSLPRTVRSLFTTRDTLVQAAMLGDVLMLCVPGEMTHACASRIAAQTRALGIGRPVVVGLANDYIGYVLTRGQFMRGGYEAEMSFQGPRLDEALGGAVTSSAMALSDACLDRPGIVRGREWATCGMGSRWAEQGVECLRLVGGPAERGYQHGSLMREEIGELAAREKRWFGEATGLPAGWRAVLRLFFRRYLFVMESRLTPGQVLELHELAQAAGISYEDALFHQFATELAALPFLQNRLGPDDVSSAVACSREWKTGLPASSRAGKPASSLVSALPRPAAAPPVLHAVSFGSAMADLLRESTTVFFSVTGGRRPSLALAATAWPGMIGWPCGMALTGNGGGAEPSATSFSIWPRSTQSRLPMGATVLSEVGHLLASPAPVARMRSSPASLMAALQVRNGEALLTCNGRALERSLWRSDEPMFPTPAEIWKSSIASSAVARLETLEQAVRRAAERGPLDAYSLLDILPANQRSDEALSHAGRPGVVFKAVFQPSTKDFWVSAGPGAAHFNLDWETQKLKRWNASFTSAPESLGGPD